MMKASELTEYLKQRFPQVTFYTGAIDRNNPQCVGVYPKGEAEPHIALGGVANTSYSTLPITLLVHWSENADLCEQMAIDLYQALYGQSNFYIVERRIISVKMLTSHPVFIGRDEGNIVENVIRAHIIYEREVM